MYCRRGHTFLMQRDFEKAKECYEHCLTIAKELSDRAAEGSTYCCLGNVYRFLGNGEEAIE